MKMNLRQALVFAVAGFALLGCAVEENPVTPDKMQQIRKQEANERANFHPGGAGGPSEASK